MRTQDLGLLVLRATLGVVFVAHGAQKLFGWFGGEGFAAQVDQMESLGLEPATFMALMAGLSEFGGGILLLLGLLTPLASVALAVVMVVATVTVTGENGFFAQGDGFEYNLVLFAAAVTLGLTGAGRLSADRLLATALPLRVRPLLRQQTVVPAPA